MSSLRNSCESHYGTDSGNKIFQRINQVFAHLPLAALIDGSIFCAHGGLCPKLTNLDMINNVKPVETSSSDEICHGLLWADPHKAKDDFLASSRDHSDPAIPGPVINTWGPKVTEKFLRDNDLSFIVRAHEMCENGAYYHHNGKVITLFSSSNYCGCGNIGAYMVWSKYEKHVKKMIESGNKAQKH